jgi:predicted small secreted protein
MRKLILGSLILAIGALYLLTAQGCNTFKGFGTDIQRAAENTQQAMFG